MSLDFSFDSSVLDSLVGGLSSLEISHLNIQNLDQANRFLDSYGFNLSIEDDKKKLWAYHRRAVTYLQEELLKDDEKIPEMLTDPNQLKDICYLLIYASTKDRKENSVQKWACAILKVVHILVHLDNDLFTKFSSDIQEQILRPIQAHIYNDPVSGVRLGSSSATESIDLKKFEVKPFKRSDSSVTKLLAKPEVVAFTLLDKIGVRIITKSLFDVFRVLRYLIKNHIVSLPHNIPDQSNNTIYPVNIFLEAMESLPNRSKMTVDQVDEILYERLQAKKDQAEYRQKFNVFTSQEYRFIKFISRRLIKVDRMNGGEKKPLSFFYPYEVQIMDYKSFLNNLKGSASHEAYKKRQKRMARARTLGIQ